MVVRRPLDIWNHTNLIMLSGGLGDPRRIRKEERRVCRFYKQHAEQSPMIRNIYEKVQRIETLLVSGSRMPPVSQHEEDPELVAALDALGER